MAKKPLLSSPIVMFLVVLLWTAWAGYLAWSPISTPTPTSTSTRIAALTATPKPTNTFTPTPTLTTFLYDIEITSLEVTNQFVVPESLVFIVADLKFDSPTITQRWYLTAGNIKTGQGTNVILYEAPDTPGTYEITFEAAYESQKVKNSVFINVVTSTPTWTPTPTATPTLPPTLTSTLTGTTTSTTTPTLPPTPSSPPTWTPIPTATPTIDSRQVTLISPATGTSFNGQNERIQLQWEEWPAGLKEGEYYFVDAKFTGIDEQSNCREGWSFYKWTKETAFVVDPWLYDILCPTQTQRKVEWTIRIGQPTNSLEMPDGIFSLPGDTWSFNWIKTDAALTGGGGGGSTSPPLVGPGPD